MSGGFNVFLDISKMQSLELEVSDPDFDLH